LGKRRAGFRGKAIKPFLRFFKSTAIEEICEA
jgi:hypothetical protein